MGQYHILANLTKKQFIHPHGLGTGLKLWEQSGAWVGRAKPDDIEFHGSAVTYAAWMLLASANGRGGGDYNQEEEHDAEHLIGSWAGDRIALIGDYAEEQDLIRSGEQASRELDARQVYELIQNARYPDDADSGPTDWLNITPAVVLLICAAHELKFNNNNGGWGRWEVALGAAPIQSS